MKDKFKTKEQLIAELAEKRQRIAELEAAGTECKRAEQALIRLASSVRMSTDSIVLSDIEGKIIEVNRATLEMYGTDDEGELVGKISFDLLAPEERAKALAGMQEVLKKGYVKNQEYHVIAKDGSRIPVEMSTAILKDADGRPVGFVGISRDITARKRAEAALRQRTAQLEALREVSLELTAQLDLDTLLHSVASRAVELLGGVHGGVYLYRPERDLLEWAVSVDDPTPIGITLGRGEGLAGKVWESGEAMIVDDYRHWEGRDPFYDKFDFTSIVDVPIRWRDEFLGVLNVNGDSTRTFSETDAEVLSMLAAQAAIAIRNAQILQAEHEQRELAESLEEAAAIVSSTLDIDDVLDRILEQVERVVPGDVFNIMLIEDGVARAVRWRGQERFDAEEFISTVAFRISEVPTLQQMVETGKSVILPDTGADPNWVNLPALKWLRSYVAAPIQVAGQTVGFLNVDGAQPNQFGPTDARRLEAFASHAAAAIKNAQLHQELREHAGQLEQRVQERTSELEAQYAWLDTILDSTTDGIVVTNEKGSIAHANPVAQAWLTQTLSPQEAARLREAIRGVVTRAEEQPVEILELTGLDLELSAALVVGEEAEKPTAAVVDIHDVSHLKSLDRMKSRFITNISHELRTPITTIKLYVYLMQRKPEKREQYLDVLAQEADHQVRLIEDILEISRIDTGRIEMKPRPTALNELTEATVVRHRELAQEQGVTLEHHPAEPGPVTMVDPERMVQVLSNLVGNAIRFTPAGGKVVLSTGTEKTEGRTWATVTVADTGMGIPENELPRVFDRFFRGEKPRAMQLTGTGMGLAIVKEIVELHGGRVTVESQVDVGSTFTVWLPLGD